jgi:hypothetical protein
MLAFTCPRADAVQVFLDTEFTNLETPSLLSLALVADDGREHYVELDMNERANAGQAMEQASDFVRSTVLPMWSRVPCAAATYAEMARRTSAWLAALGPVEVLYDYSVDFELLERLLSVEEPGARPRLEPVHVGYLLDDADGKLAAARSLGLSTSQGLGEHHALADARALRARFHAVHGAY